MAKDVSFSLDTTAAQAIIQDMAMPIIKRSADAIGARAQSIASSISSDPPEITVTVAKGTIRRGVRAIGTVRASGRDAHQNYIGHVTLSKAKDAGKVN